MTPSLTACRGANRSNRGTLSTCQAVPSQHTAALSLYSFTGVSISVCGNCAALRVSVHASIQMTDYYPIGIFPHIH